MITKYNLELNECLYIDDNQKKIDTGIIVGFKSIKVKADDLNAFPKVTNVLDLL